MQMVLVVCFKIFLMRIKAHINNPIIKKSDDFRELDDRIKQVDPSIYSLKVTSNKIIIERNGRKSFRFTAHPSIEWVMSKVKCMKEYETKNRI